MACNKVSQETRKISVVAQGQHYGRDLSLHQASLEAYQTRVNRLRGWKTLTSSDQDANLSVHFNTKQTQVVRGSQQLL